MPFVTIRILEGHPIERKRAMSKEVAEVIAKHAKINENLVQVVFHDIPKHNWFANGDLCEIKKDK